MKTLERGTEIVVRLNGVEYKGTVVGGANNWGTEEAPNWYIEFLCNKGVYRYWKQEEDGGTLFAPKF